MKTNGRVTGRTLAGTRGSALEQAVNHVHREFS